MSDSNGQFSFDVYPGLDAELNAAYARNQARDGVAPEAVATEGIAAAVADTLEQQEPEHVLSPDVHDWAQQELGDNSGNSAIAAWRKYDSFLAAPVPGDLDALLESNPNLESTLARLHKAKAEITADGGATPQELNAGETMHLTLMPWQDLRNHLDDLPDWIKRMRDAQGVASVDDFINGEILRQLSGGDAMYRNPISPHFFTTNNTQAPDWVSARDYLDERIARDGPWGVILTQTSEKAGLQDRTGDSPDVLTNEGHERLMIAGHKVDGLGILEWLAMTLQHDPRTLSPWDESSGADYTWMLANRLNVRGGSRVPYGDWGDDQVDSNLYYSVDRDANARPRLAVI